MFSNVCQFFFKLLKDQLLPKLNIAFAENAFQLGFGKRGLNNPDLLINVLMILGLTCVDPFLLVILKSMDTITLTMFHKHSAEELAL